MQKIWNPSALLMGIQKVAEIMENSVKNPQRINIELPYNPGILIQQDIMQLKEKKRRKSYRKLQHG